MIVITLVFHLINYKNSINVIKTFRIKTLKHVFTTMHWVQISQGRDTFEF